jgi:hypothetical protein
MRKKFPVKIVKKYTELAEKTWQNFKDNPKYPRTPEQKKENRLRGLLTEFACFQDFQSFGVNVSRVYEGNTFDDGKDIKAPRGSVNVKGVLGPEFDSGHHTKLLKSYWDKGDFYAAYKVYYPTQEYEFIGFIESNIARSVEPCLLKSLNPNFEELVLKIK